MTTFSYEESQYRYNPYTKQIEQIDITPEQIDWITTAIEINTTDIELKVSSDEVLSEINLSTEWISITWDRIAINWSTTFATNYDPSNVQTDQLWNTVIDWWKILTSILDVDDIFAQNITATWTITWATIKTDAWNDRVEMFADWIAAYASWTKRVEINWTWTWRLQFYTSWWNETWYITWYLLNWTITSTLVRWNLMIWWNDSWTPEAVDLLIWPSSWIKFEEGWPQPAELYSNWENLFFRNEDWDIEQITSL